MDISDFLHFVNSGRWHCTISMESTRLNEDIDRAVLGVCLAGKIDGFDKLVTLFERLDESGRVSFD